MKRILGLVLIAACAMTLFADNAEARRMRRGSRNCNNCGTVNTAYQGGCQTGGCQTGGCQPGAYNSQQAWNGSQQDWDGQSQNGYAQPNQGMAGQQQGQPNTTFYRGNPTAPQAQGNMQPAPAPQLRSNIGPNGADVRVQPNR